MANKEDAVNDKINEENYELETTSLPEEVKEPEVQKLWLNELALKVGQWKNVHRMCWSIRSAMPDFIELMNEVDVLSRKIKKLDTLKPRPQRFLERKITKLEKEIEEILCQDASYAKARQDLREASNKGILTDFKLVSRLSAHFEDEFLRVYELKESVIGELDEQLEELKQKYKDKYLESASQAELDAEKMYAEATTKQLEMMKEHATFLWFISKELDEAKAMEDLDATDQIEKFISNKSTNMPYLKWLQGIQDREMKDVMDVINAGKKLLPIQSELSTES